MTGPWEDYQTETPSSPSVSAQGEQGPWNDYATPASAQPESGGFGDTAMKMASGFGRPLAFFLNAKPVVDQFISNAGNAAVSHAVKDFTDTAEVPSLGHYFKEAAEDVGKTVVGIGEGINKGVSVAAGQAPVSSIYGEKPTAAEVLHNRGEGILSKNTAELLAQSVMQGPVGTGVGIMYAPQVQALAPLFNVGREAAVKSGVDPLWIDAPMAALTILGVAHAGGVNGDTAQGLSDHVIGSPEDVAMGSAKPTPAMEEAAGNAAALTDVAKERAARLEAQRGLVDVRTGPDINDIVRRMQPELFGEKDRLDTQQEMLRDRIRHPEETIDKEINLQVGELEKQRASLNQVPTELEGDELHRAVQENTAKGAQIDEQIRFLKSPEYRESQIQQAREQFQKNDYRLRDLAPDVRRAYTAAQEFVPPEPEPQPKPEEAAAQGPWNTPKAEEPAPAETNRIAETFSKMLQDAGRPKDEADATAALVQAHYRAVAAQGWAKGTAEEIFERHKPEIVRGEAKQAKRIIELSQGRELEQGGARGSFLLPFGDFKGGVIGLRPGADASTVVHELGHAWLEEMTQYAKEPDAPQSLTDHMKVLRDWLGSKEGEIWTRAQHEKFARGFERYLREGTAPSRGLAEVFAKFKQWMTDIYKSVRSLRAPMTDAVRNVFDHLLEANPEKTVLAPDHEPGKLIADIHETDARMTPPEQAASVRDTMEKEIDRTAKLHNPEVADELTAAETGGVETAAVGASADAGAAGAPGTGNTGAAEEPSEVAAGGGGPWGTGSAARGADAATGAADAVGSKPAEGAKPGGPNEPIGRSDTKLLDKVGNIRWENLTSDDSVTDVARQIWEQAGSPDEEAQGKAITQRDIASFAESLGVEESKLNVDKLRELTRVDGIPLAFRIRAARKMLVDSATRISGMMADSDSWSEEDAAKYAEAKAQHIMVAKVMSGITAEWGRAGHAFRDISGDQMKTAQDITELLQSATGRTFEELKKEAKLGQKLNKPGQVSKYVKDSSQPTFVDKMLWYRNNCLLSGPITHLTYLEGNQVNLAMRSLEIEVAARIGQASGATEGPVKGEGAAMFYALFNPSAFRNAAESWKEQVAVLPGDQGKKYTSLMMNRQMVKGPLGTALQQVTRSIDALHSFIYTMAYNQQIAGQSFRLAMREGLEPGTDAFAKRLADLRTNQPAEMMKDATEEAFKEVNMGKSGPVLGKLSLFLNSNAATRFLFPFVKMEMNVMRNTWLERTPLGLMSKDIRANLAGVNGEAARDLQRAKMLTTTGVAATLFALGSQYINGDGPSDPNKNRVWRLTHTPNSIQFGDVVISLKSLGRLGSQLRFATGMKESFQGWEGDDGDHVARALTEHLAHNFDTSFTDGLKNVIDLAFNHERPDVARFVQNFVTQFLPFSTGLGQLAHQVDPFARDTKPEPGPLGSVEGIMKAAAARVPGASYFLDHQFDMFGQPISNSVFMDYHSRYDNDPVVQRMNALHISVGRLDHKIFGVELNGRQYAEYSQLAGLHTKEVLDRMVTPQFAAQPQAVQISAIHDAISASRDFAKQIILHENPDVKARAVEFQRVAHGRH